MKARVEADPHVSRFRCGPADANRRNGPRSFAKQTLARRCFNPCNLVNMRCATALT